MLNELLTSLRPGLPMIAAIIVGVALIVAVRRILAARYKGQADKSLRVQLTVLVLSAILLLIVVLVSPLGDTRQGQLLNLIGIVLSAAIALSSTTFVGNVMAGLMIRAVRSFRVGDFIQVGEHFGRVSERGLFHVEIQTEERDLTTLPNLYLVTNPVKVTHSTGTLIGAEVSLGYDVPRGQVQEALRAAADAAELRDPFVHVMDLGNFAVVYRVLGLLPEVKHILTARSRLREQMLDKLHAAGIEIASPTFMNQRQLDPRWRAVPPVVTQTKPSSDAGEAETVMFDKAEKAESREELRRRLEAMGQDIKSLEDALKDAKEDTTRRALESQLETKRRARDRLADHLDSLDRSGDQES